MILLIDGNNLAARANFAEPNLCRFDGTKTGVVYVSLRSIKSLIETFSPEKIIFVFDRGWSDWRLQFYPEYKADRKDCYKTPEEIEQKQAYINQIKRLQKYISNLSFTQIAVKKCEADDIIGFILNKAIKNNYQEKFLLVSNDKDFYQFVPFGVKIYDGIKKCFIDENYIKEKLDIPSNQYIFYKSMLGDKGDNIDSIKGFGGTSAAKLIKTKNINEIEEIKEIAKTIKGSRYEKLVENFDIVKRNFKLINLINNDALTEENIKEINSQLTLKTNFNLNKLIELSKEDEINWDENFFTLLNLRGD